MEVLEDVLSMCRFRVALYCRCETYAPWGIAIPQSTTAQFHAVRAGGCWIRLQGGRAARLEEGDFVLVPHGDAHEVLYSPETKAMGLPEVLALAGSSDCRVLRLAGSGPFTALVCGGCDFGNRAHKSLFSFLPKLVHLHAKESAALRPILDLADQELREPRPASSIVLARLGDILFIEAMRAYSLRLRPGEGSWLGATLDPNIAQVLRLIHSDPSNGWSLDVLATKAAMSRSSLATRFRDLVGVSIMVHVTRVRMIHAWAMLEDPELSIAEISSRAGYDSVASFHRAFVREVGMPPGDFRKKVKEPPTGFLEQITQGLAISDNGSI
jgi:AraC-like DNA-binding protein